MASPLLNVHPDSVLLARYQAAQDILRATPDDRAAQHRAVLCLARLGAIDFAMAEYDRFGLAAVDDNEDYLSLGARLYKDLFLRADDEDGAQSYGLRSAALYETAFEKTGGYYSGVNAATMALLTGAAPTTIESRARAILDRLPQWENLTPIDHYYVEATRAEAWLLRGDIDRAERALRRAVRFDPLNYTAHATTLKQLKLICAAQHSPVHWLDELEPPRPICFAGHIWREAVEGADAVEPIEAALRQSLSDLIQSQDIGFAYGALAAGADIIMAESFLAEGVALHLVFPSAIDVFMQNSVVPFGQSWVPRFEACLAGAASVTIMQTSSGPTLDLHSTKVAAEISMGQAILRARDFSNAPGQLLAVDSNRQNSLTHVLQDRWHRTGYETFSIPVRLTRAVAKAPQSDEPGLRLALLSREGLRTRELADPTDIFAWVADVRGGNLDKRIAIDFDRVDVSKHLAACLAKAVPGSTIISAALAALLTLARPHDICVSYAGVLRGDGPHIYSLV